MFQSNGSNIAYTYNGDDQLITEIGSGAIGAYETHSAYDANGNLISQTRTEGGALSSTYGYDLTNNMTSATVGGVTTTYAYDYNGVLISEATAGVTTYYVNDPTNLTGDSKAIQESLTPGGTPTISYVVGLRVEAQSDTTNGTLYLLVDGHGSTRALADSTGAVVSGQTFDYDAFGDVLANTSTAETVWLFGGDGVYDHATGWTYQLARWRTGATFTTSDSASGTASNPASLQKYGYADANPISGTDPSGHDDSLDQVLGDSSEGTDFQESDAYEDDGYAQDDSGGGLADEAFGEANDDIAEDEGGYDAVQNHLGGQIGNVYCYAAMGFAGNDLLGTATSFDAQGAAVTFGMTAAGAVGGLLLEGGAELFAAADEGGGAASGSESEVALEDTADDLADDAADCGENTSCFLAGTVVLRGDGTTETPIQDIAVGDRVATDGGVANSPTGTTAADPNATSVDPATWREVTIVAGDWDVETLEPLSWITAENVHPGGSLDLNAVVDVQEMGVPGDLVGTVESIAACPTIQSGPGRVVTTTVNHLNDDVYELTLKNAAGQIKTLGVTGTHRFYDEATGWVQVQSLYNGEVLRDTNGDLTVAAVVQTPGTDRVYKSDS